jgi:sulfur-carrier protein
MPHVLAMGGDVGAFTGGATAFDVAPGTVRSMIRELEARYPGLGDYVGRRMAIAIDGEIFQDADGATALAESSEVCLIPKIGGG